MALAPKKSRRRDVIIKPPVPSVSPRLAYVPVTDEQVAILLQTQQAVTQAQSVVTEHQGRLDTLLLGIMGGAHLTSGRAIRLTDEQPRRLEIELP